MSAILFLESKKPFDYSNLDDDSVYLTLDIPGGPLYFQARINNEMATLSDLVPLARAISSSITDISIQRAQQQEEPVKCNKGCSTCCSYLVPLSVPEAFRLREEFLNLPGDRQAEILELTVDSAKQVLDNKLTEHISEYLDSADPRITANRVSRWYAGFKLVCPFLTEDICSCYPDRPLACREHIVTGPASYCAGLWSDMQQVVELPVSGLEALAVLTAELENTEIESIMFPLAIIWAQNNLERSEKTWPTRHMVERFFEILKDIAMKKASKEAVLP